MSGGPGSEWEGTKVRERLAVSPRAHLGVDAALHGPTQISGWVGRYLRNTVALDAAVALAAGLLALRGRYDTHGHVPTSYIILTASLPVIWVSALALAGAYEARFIGAGPDELRRVINAGLGLTSAIAVLSYLTKAQVSRSYMLVAMPAAVGLDLLARYGLRKRLHRLREHGVCLQRAVAVGHSQDVANLVNELRREPYHGLTVIAACLAGPVPFRPDEVAGVRCSAGSRTWSRRSVRRTPTRWPCWPARNSTVSGCGGWPGRWRRPARTCAWLRHCSTWPARVPMSVPRPGCRCCTWTIPTCPASARSSRACSTRW